MIFLICLILAGILAFIGNQQIRKHANVLYLVSAAISGIAIVGTALHLPNALPAWLRDGLWFSFAYGSFATAVFVLVMFAGAVPRGSIIQKKLIPIRKELSIIASILTLGHNFSAGQIYFVWLFTKPEVLQGTVLWATLCSVVLILIMLPLFITSFTVIRKKMKPATWKNLQKLSYLFYGLIYLHVLLLFVPKAQAGRDGAWLNVAVFSIVFLAYAAMRLRKAMDAKGTLLKNIPAVIAVVLCVAVGYFSMPVNVAQSPVAETKPETATEQSHSNSPEKTVSEEKPESEKEQANTTAAEKKEESTAKTETTAGEQTAEATQPEKEKEVAAQSDSNAPSEANDKKDNAPAAQKQEETKDTSAKPEEPKKDAVSSSESQTEKPATNKEEPKSAPTAETPKQPEAPKAEEKPVAEAPKVEPTAPQPAETPDAPKTEPAPAPAPAPAPEPAPAPVFKYKNGTFNGSADGYNDKITVSVTIKDDVITGIQIVSHSDDEPFWTNAKAITGSILSAQSADVNTVSGATFSSRGIKEAVKAALNSAKN